MRKIKGKDILYGVFPFIPMFTHFGKTWKGTKEDLKEFNFWDSILGWALKLYSITIAIPLVVSFLHIFGCILTPESMRYGFFEGIWEIFSGFYVTGTFLEVAAWRWQLALLLFSFLLTWMTKNED